MAELLLTVAGRSYRLACRDDDEIALRQAAQSVDQRATQLAGRMGAVGESRLLLMTALSFAGEPGNGVAAPVSDPHRLQALADRLERLADDLERTAGAH